MYVTVGQYLYGNNEVANNEYKSLPPQQRVKMSDPTSQNRVFKVSDFSKPVMPIPKPIFTPQPLEPLEPLGNTSDPKVWGPPFWYSLHVSASHYPLEASPIVKERMKGRILALPYEIPCQKCRVHANAFVEKHRDNLDTIVSGRHSLGKFYVDFHNQVNKRYGKPEWSYEDAYRYYSGKSSTEL